MNVFTKCMQQQRGQNYTELDQFICIKLFGGTVIAVILAFVSFAESLWIMCFWPLDPRGGLELLLSALLSVKPSTAGLRLWCPSSR